MATCRGCEARIVWAVTENGKPMPIDAEPNDEGNVILLAGRRAVGRHGPAPVVRVLGKPAQLDLLDPSPTIEERLDDESADGKRYMPHFVTCPQRDQFRRTT